MKRKIISAVLTLALLATMVAMYSCGGDDTGTDTSATESVADTSAADTSAEDTTETEIAAED